LGPVDTEIGLLRLDTIDGKPLALVYSFAVHAYGGIPGGEVTADLPGFASGVIETAWPGAVALFVQGAAGDITPVRYKDFDSPPPTEQLGTMLGLSVLSAAQHLTLREGIPVRVQRTTLELPRRTDLRARIESLSAEQEEILQFYSGAGCGTHGAGTALNFKAFVPLYLKHAIDPALPAQSFDSYAQEEALGQDGLRHLDAENKQRLENYLECVRRMERLICIRTSLSLLEQQLQRTESGPLCADIMAWRVGDFAIVSFPGEPFVEVGLRIRQQSPWPHTFLAGYSNGSLGYAPTADSYDKDAYEDALTRLAPQWQSLYETKALEMLRHLQHRPAGSP
jgi:hypothetical protein